MADGSIVYEVRVDSGNIDSDLSRAGTLLEKGTKQINSLAANTARDLGKMLSDVFGKSAEYAGGAVTRLGTGLDSLKSAAAPLYNALAPVASALTNISKINLSNLGTVTGKINAATNMASAAKSYAGAMAAVPSFACGTSYIPYDDFPALLHKGEAVLTASENAALKSAGGIGAPGLAQPVVVKNETDLSALSELANRPIEVSMKIGEYEFTQVITDSINNLYRQWGTKPLK